MYRNHSESCDLLTYVVIHEPERFLSCSIQNLKLNLVIPRNRRQSKNITLEVSTLPHQSFESILMDMCLALTMDLAMVGGYVVGGIHSSRLNILDALQQLTSLQHSNQLHLSRQPVTRFLLR